MKTKVQNKIRDAKEEEILQKGGTIFRVIADVTGEYNLEPGEKLLRTHWRDKNGVDHYDLAVATSDPAKVQEMMRKHHQQTSFAINPDGRTEFFTADEHTPNEGKSPLPGKMDEVIELDFGKYWGCTNKKLSIRSMIDVQRWGAKIEKLPKWVQDKIEEARKVETSLTENLEGYLQGRYGNEEVDENGRKCFALIKHSSGPAATRVERKIFALSEEVAGSFKFMGTADGQCFNHCVYLALKYSPLFFDRVCGYKIVHPQRPEMKFAVSFYEKKPN